MQVKIRQNKYLNNKIKDDHQFIKKKTKEVLWFKNFWGAIASNLYI
jgi:transposase-like protein